MKTRRIVHWKDRKWRIRSVKKFRDDRVSEANFETRTISYLSGLSKEDRLACLIHEYGNVIDEHLTHNQLEPFSTKLAKFIIENNL